MGVLLMLAAVTHGAAVPLLWIIGVICIIGGIVTLFRGSVLSGAVLIILGIFLGGLNVF